MIKGKCCIFLQGTKNVQEFVKYVNVYRRDSQIDLMVDVLNIQTI